jgi:MFS family permease
VKSAVSVHRDVVAVLVAKCARTFCYGFLGILLPLYLSDLGMSARGVGFSVTLTLVGSAALTWAIRRPAERLGSRSALLALSALTAMSAALLLSSRHPWVIVLAAMLGNVAVGAGETGPFLTIEQVIVARAVAARGRTQVLAVYNLLGYAAAALGAVIVGRFADPRPLFGAFLAAAVVQALAYTRLGDPEPESRRRAARGPLPSARRIRGLAALFALDSFAGGFVLQSLIAYFLHERYDLNLAALGRIFFVAQLLTALSLLLAARFALRFGLLNTMVFSHLASNVALIAIAFAPTAGVAVGLLFVRQLMSQIDVPTRQAYVMGVVKDHEREAAATTTTLWRTVTQAVSPTLTGWIMESVALNAPFVVGGVLKIVYDLLLYATFRHVKPDPLD